MRKFLCLFLALAMLFSFAACGSKKAQAEPDTIQTEEVPLGIPAEDEIYSQVAPMLAPVEKFVQYNHILNNSVNYENVDSEDFWNIVALAVSAYEDTDDFASVDVAGVYHVKWAQALDFAKCFMYRSWYSFQAPSYQSSYSASADPGTGIIDLIPLDVDNYDAELEYIDYAPAGTEYDYVLHIALNGKEDDPLIHHYEVFIADWTGYIKDVYGMDDPDSGKHILPFAVTGYEFINTEDRSLENESQN